MCNLPSHPPLRLPPPLSSLRSSSHSILFPGLISFSFTLFLLVSFFPQLLCSSHLPSLTSLPSPSSTFLILLFFMLLSSSCLCFLSPNSLFLSTPLLPFLPLFPSSSYSPVLFLFSLPRASSFVLPLLLPSSYLSSLFTFTLLFHSLLFFFFPLSLFLPPPLPRHSRLPQVLMEGGFADFSVFQLKG